MSHPALIRKGKVTSETLGKCVLVSLRGRYDPDPLGEDGPATTPEYMWKDYLVPMKQCTNNLQGYDPETEEQSATISRSVSYNDELRKYSQARYPRKEAA